MIEADHLTQTVRGGRHTLHNVSLVVRPGELVAVIGTSGAGKTTLLDALAGVRPPTTGRVRYFGEPSAQVGYVPQDDIIHLDLPLVSTLRYAARLRLAPGTDVVARVEEVLAVLGLTGRADVPVGSLSGGERKRASIAVELLARPAALFLDEPTSGLDPATAAELLGLLRRFAADGVPVVLTTHNPADVDRCDQVIVLAPTGRLAFAGTPAEARSHFAVTAIADIYARLAESPSFRQERPAPGDATSHPADRAPALGALRQAALLTVRGLDILRRNKLTLAILLGSPLVILAMFLMLFQGGAFDLQSPSPNTTVMTLFWVAFGVFFFGLTYGLLQICVEMPILRREVFAGVRPVAYVVSKVAVLLPLLAVVDLLLLVVLRALDRLPALTGLDFTAFYLTALLASAAALSLGLLCSASVSDAAQASLMLPMLCFPQVLFVGAILPVPQMAAVGRWISYAMSNRWSFEAFGHTAGLPSLWTDGGSPLGPPLLASYGDSFSAPAWHTWAILAGFTIFFLVVTCVVVHRKTAR